MKYDSNRLETDFFENKFKCASCNPLKREKLKFCPKKFE